MLPEYDERFEKPREQWLHGYFNWTEEKDITEAERHTARDGFDAGMNWATRNLVEILNGMREEDRLDIIRMFCGYCGGPKGCQCWNDD